MSLLYMRLNQTDMTQSGSEGGSFFKALEDRLPDLILLDIMLPGEDGIEILKSSKCRLKHGTFRLS